MVEPERRGSAIAVVINTKKSMTGGLTRLRAELARSSLAEVRFYEAKNSRSCHQLARQAVDEGAELLFVWGGDGTVQQCVDAVATREVVLAILPAGTANLLAMNLGIPTTIAEAVSVGLHGKDRTLDVGKLNGERFAVMAGVGLDAEMMHLADQNLKDRFGRLAYLWTGTRASRKTSRRMRIKVDGRLWFDGRASCVLLGQMGKLGPGVMAFPDAKPDDLLLDVGVVTAKNAAQWLRVAGRLAVGQPNRSPLTKMCQGRKVDISLARRIRYELDGGPRKKKKHLRAKIEPGCLTVRVPALDTN
jgi:YegS/Rv2252/BmrU family lipid kinase